MTVQSFLFLLIQKFTVASDPLKLLQTNLYWNTAKLQNSSNDAFEYYLWTFCPWKNENKNAYTA